MMSCSVQIKYVLYLYDVFHNFLSPTKNCFSCPKEEFHTNSHLNSAAGAVGENSQFNTFMTQ